MIFNTYKTAAAFAAAVTDTISRHEIQNNLFYRIYRDRSQERG
jgi:hypothetical protein